MTYNTDYQRFIANKYTVIKYQNSDKYKEYKKKYYMKQKIMLKMVYHAKKFERLFKKKYNIDL
jgi:hypothetical protein